MGKFRDLADLPEDERIIMIGEAAMTGKTVAFVTDSDPGKAERYITKLMTAFPKLEVISKSPGPVPDTITVKVQKSGKLTTGTRAAST